MARFIVRRFFTGILVLVFVTMLVFFISRVYGDPIQNFIPDEGYGMQQEELGRLRRQLHLDRAVPIQYAFWLGDLLTGDLGIDLQDRQPISAKVTSKLGPTLSLAGIAWVIATVLGVPLGILSAVKRGTVWDLIGRSFAVLGHSLPSFWIGITSILIFAVWLDLLPAGTMGISGTNPKNFILPALILAWLPMSGYTRLVRSSMLEIMDSEFVKLARAKGVSPTSVLFKHAFRNAVIAPLTFSGLLLAGLIHGSIAVETVFSWPGVARWGVEAVWNNNLNVLSIVTLLFTLAYVAASFLTDVLYAFVDPRIRLT